MPGALRIDFAARDARRAGAVVLIAGCVAAAAVVGVHVHVGRSLEAAQARVEALRARLDPALGARSPFSPAEARAQRSRVEAASRVLDALEQPWIRLFDQLESALVDGVSLLAMEPDAAKASVRIVGEARDADTLARYLERLGRLGALSEVRLNQHELREGAEAAALRFTVSARWVRPS